jgi:hypothetical protein
VYIERKNLRANPREQAITLKMFAILLVVLTVTILGPTMPVEPITEERVSSGETINSWDNITEYIDPTILGMVSRRK